ncbi:MAG: hypothetical protein HS108_04405 [Planctomycetes bacterium]|jgi:hypothetical protein|nr:hypothetical protein [Planctomycetota bacterium]MCL4731616.1 hypothetical protein [Planctomycetota bacterium]
MPWCLAALLLWAALAAPAAARQIDFVNLGVPEHRAARVQSQIEPAFAHVQARTGLADDREVFVTIVQSGRRFAEIAAADGVSMDSESVLGYAVPSRRRVVLNFAAMDERGLEPLGVLRHEIAHLVLGGLAAPRPLWFEEGVANWVENMAFNALVEGAQVPLVAADFAGLDDLSAGLRDQRAPEAYPESRRVIELIVQTWGRPALTKLLAELEGGTGFEAAFAAATGDNLARLEQLWLQDRADRASGRLVLWLGANWGWLIFAGAGGLLLAAVVIKRRRGRRQVDQWEEQEKLFPSDPAWSYTEPDEGFSTDEDGEPAARR